MSKVVEPLVCRQLVAYLEQNVLLPDLEFAYRRCWSTETGVVKVVADLLTTADRGEVTLLSLLALSAAFDAVDQDILIDRLYDAFVFPDCEICLQCAAYIKTVKLKYKLYLQLYTTTAKTVSRCHG